MSSNTILILGDSTSMSIGLERKTYPYLLADSAVWPERTTFLNCSMPGFTSADGAAFFFQSYAAVANEIGAVIVYLGNCDTTSSEVHKGRYSKTKYWQHKFREQIGKPPAKTRLKNRLLHFEWNNTYDPLIELPENPEDFEYNIGRILAICHRQSIPAILVLPKANLYFPPGVGKGNFVFYRYVGMKEKIADKLNIADQRFVQALKFHENGDFDKALSIYEEILRQPSAVTMSQEYPLVVLNNYAAAKAEAGYTEEAVYLFELMLKERQARKEIALYNLAQIRKNLGQLEEYNQLLKESYESDDSLYRIRSPYIKALERLSGRYPRSKIIDMRELVPDQLYLDHCHPLPAGQQIMADAVLAAFAEFNISGNQQAVIENRLFNPELSLGNGAEFHDYFKTYASYSGQQIAETINILKGACAGDKRVDWSASALTQVPKEIKTAIEYYFRHPCFTTVTDIVHLPPHYASDIGRFPEYFLVRHLIPYLRAHEANADLAARFNPYWGLLRSSAQMLSILPPKATEWVGQSQPDIDPSSEKVRLLSILNKVRGMLIQHLRTGNVVHERIKTTIFWYVRECLRFGGHSRVSMLYERVLLEYLAEGLAVAGVLDAALKAGQSEEINRLIGLLESTVEIHEDYCGRFTMTNCTDEFFLSYNQKLSALADVLE